MSDFLLEQVCKYLKEGKIVIKFNITQCIERDIYGMSVFDRNNNFIERFDIRKGDMEVIMFVVKMEGLQHAIK